MRWDREKAQDVSRKLGIVFVSAGVLGRVVNHSIDTLTALGLVAIGVIALGLGLVKLDGGNDDE